VIASDYPGISRFTPEFLIFAQNSLPFEGKRCTVESEDQRSVERRAREGAQAISSKD
jgi:hypothetical protein